jgi:hypothetical protein
VTRFDWDKAKRASGEPREKKPNTRRQQMLRQTAMADYVAKHELACFKCSRTEGEWAKTGLSSRGPWVICLDCVRSGTA